MIKGRGGRRIGRGVSRGGVGVGGDPNQSTG